MEKARSPMPIGRWIGEFIIIVLGVFAALLADRWQSTRNDSDVVAKYVVRLRTDIREDTARLGDLITRTEEKMAALRELEILIMRPPTESSADLASTLLSATLNLEQDFRSTAFDELLSTGQLNRIRNDSTREAIMAYYENIDRFLPRIEARRTELLKRLIWHVPPSARPDSTRAQVSLHSDWPVKVVRDPEFARMINSEFEYSAFARRRFEVIRRSGLTALERIGTVYTRL